MLRIITLLKIYKKNQLVFVSQCITSYSRLYPATCVMRQCFHISIVCPKIILNTSFYKTRSSSYINGYIEIPLKNDFIKSFLCKSFCLYKSLLKKIKIIVTDNILCELVHGSPYQPLQNIFYILLKKSRFFTYSCNILSLKNNDLYYEKPKNYKHNSFHLKTRSVTYLENKKPLYKNIVCTMFTSTIKTTGRFANPRIYPQANTRGFALAHAGRLNLKTIKKNQLCTKQPTASCDDFAPIVSDVKNIHDVVVIAVCKKLNCKHTNCSDPLNENKNPCNVSPTVHQQPIKDVADIFNKNNIVIEFTGALTHKPPHGATSTLLKDIDIDISNNKQDQHVVHEKGVIPLNPIDFKESIEKTLYVQENITTGRIITNASPMSVINLNDKTPTTLLSKVNTPLDEGF